MPKDDEYLESVLKDIHKAELDRSDKLDSSVNLPTAVLTVLLGVGAFYVEHLPSFDWKFPIVAFYLSVLLFFLSLASAIICLFMSYFRYRYRILANPKELVDFSRSLRKFYEEQGDEEIDEKVKTDTIKTLIDQYVECSTQNREKNLRRTYWLFRTTGCIIACLVGLGISKIFYQSVDKKTPQDISISSFPKDASVKLQASGTQSVELVNQPQANRVELIQGTAVQKVEMTGQPPVQKVEINFPKKEN